MKRAFIAVLLSFGIASLAYAAATKFTELESETMTTTVGYKLPVVNVAVSTPTAAGLLVRTSAYVVYISTATTGVASWSKVGAQ